jgi:hypothetical protein
MVQPEPVIPGADFQERLSKEEFPSMHQSLLPFAGSQGRWGRAVLATGCPRGGTTWLGRVLSLSQDSGYIFEPLTHTRHHKTSPADALKKFNRGTQRWILSWPPADEHELEHARAAARQVEELFDAYFPAPVGTLIIKQPGIRHFLLLRELLQASACVYIRRHPVAILNSYCNSNLFDGWDTREQFRLFRSDLERMWPDLSYMLASAGHDRELQVLAMCCTAHRLATYWEQEGKLIVVEYEELADGGPAYAVQLLKRLGLRLDEGKAAQLNSLFAPGRPQHGFLDTEKDSKSRAHAYTTELAPWQLRKARRYLESIGYDAPVPAQTTQARVAGTAEYCRRGMRVLQNSARAALSHARNRALRALGA